MQAASTIAAPQGCTGRRRFRAGALVDAFRWLFLKSWARGHDIYDVDQTPSSGSKGSNRRRSPRVAVAGIAVLQTVDGKSSVWRVTNLSCGGASLLGDAALLPERLSLSLHVAGFSTLELMAKVLRRQLVTRSGRCAVEFVNLSDAEQHGLLDRMQKHPAVPAVKRALIVGPTDKRTRGLAAELRALEFETRHEASPAQAAAWMQRETTTELLLVDESAIEADGWSLLRFSLDTAPAVRRLVLANDVRAFRLYYAIKAGLVDGLLEYPLRAGALVQRLAKAR